MLEKNDLLDKNGGVTCKLGQTQPLSPTTFFGFPMHE